MADGSHSLLFRKLLQEMQQCCLIKVVDESLNP